ncbi:hypothetical protein Ddc_15937 [Ditylenchus destructor]|nr:hypothetical protein Ddc_15937 [Ditylenchus destructor]
MVSWLLNLRVILQAKAPSGHALDLADMQSRRFKRAMQEGHAQDPGFFFTYIPTVKPSLDCGELATQFARQTASLWPCARRCIID